MSELDVIQGFLQRSRTMFKNRNNTNIPIANEAVKKLADKFGYTYIDVNNGLTDAP